MPADRRGDPAAVRRALIEGRTDRSLLGAEARRVCRSDALLPAGNQSRVQRQAADADSIVVKDHDRTTDEVVLDCREVGEEQVCELGSPTLALPAQQQHRRRRRVRSSEEFTEVGVARHEDPARPDCERHDFLVPGGRKSDVTQVHNVVARDAKQTDEERGLVLVEQELHAGWRSGSSRSWTARAA